MQQALKLRLGSWNDRPSYGFWMTAGMAGWVSDAALVGGMTRQAGQEVQFPPVARQETRPWLRL